MKASPLTRGGVSHRYFRRCAICGSTQDLQEHHLGGHNHAKHFTITLCRPHHEAVTVAISRAKVNMQNTTDPEERIRRARQAALVFQWFLEEAINPNQDSSVDSS